LLSCKALVINALALSRIWYVASLVFMPTWVCRELNKIIFNFFWSGKQDLVARNVFFQCPDLDGFSVVSIQLKVYSLLSQWVKRLVVCPNGWTFLLKYWLLDRFNATLLEVLPSTIDFAVSRLPPFYCALFTAWSALKGSSVSSDLVIGSGLSDSIPIASASCKASYLLPLSLNIVQPHCVLKFASSFGALD